ncbi:MAG: hypothetical protein Q7S34_03980 [bacterium]|nr:hypothetical protein [bacterium]
MNNLARATSASRYEEFRHRIGEVYPLIWQELIEMQIRILDKAISGDENYQPVLTILSWWQYNQSQRLAHLKTRLQLGLRCQRVCINYTVDDPRATIFLLIAPAQFTKAETKECP